MVERDRIARRRRALRAAQAVTLGVGMALTGCGKSHVPSDAAVPDATPDAIVDSGVDARDGAVDCSSSDWWDTEECCMASGGFWSPGGGCAVPGPFVPPALV